MSIASVKQFRLFTDIWYWRSAFLIASCEVSKQYKNSYLGALWLVLPLVFLMAVYTIIMPMIMKSDAGNYVLYLLATFPLWHFIYDCLVASTQSLLKHSETLKRCTISSSVFPVANVIRYTYSYWMNFSAMAFLLYIFGFAVSWHIFLLPLYFIPIFISIVSVCVGFAYIAPYVRDIREAITLGMNMVIWGSAVIYPITALSEKAQAIISWNPFYIMLNPVINLVHDHQLPDITVNLKLLGVMLLSIIFGYILYRIGRKNFVYYL